WAGFVYLHPHRGISSSKPRRINSFEIARIARGARLLLQDEFSPFSVETQPLHLAGSDGASASRLASLLECPPCRTQRRVLSPLSEIQSQEHTRAAKNQPARYQRFRHGESRLP